MRALLASISALARRGGSPSGMPAQPSIISTDTFGEADYVLIRTCIQTELAALAGRLFISHSDYRTNYLRARIELVERLREKIDARIIFDDHRADDDPQLAQARSVADPLGNEQSMPPEEQFHT